MKEKSFNSFAALNCLGYIFTCLDSDNKSVSSESTLATGISYCSEMFEDSLLRGLRSFLEVNDIESETKPHQPHQGLPFLGQHMPGALGSRKSILSDKPFTNVKVFSFPPYPLLHTRSKQLAKDKYNLTQSMGLIGLLLGCPFPQR